MNYLPGDRNEGSENTMNGPSSTGKSKRGRPKAARHLTRPHRIVTFVTDKELNQLEHVTQEEERSMAAVVHRIIRAHFDEQ